MVLNKKQEKKVFLRNRKNEKSIIGSNLNGHRFSMKVTTKGWYKGEKEDSLLSSNK